METQQTKLDMTFYTFIVENGALIETIAESLSFKSKKQRDFFISAQKCLKAVPWEIKKGEIGNKKTIYYATIHQPRSVEH